MTKMGAIKKILDPHVTRLHLLLKITTAVIAAIALTLIVLGPISWWLATDTVRSLHGKDQADALNAVRQTVLLSFGGVATIIGAVFTARSFALTRRGQVTDRFGKATTQLGSNKIEERLGGIYALEQVMAESSGDHAAVLEILCAFVRARAPMAQESKDDELIVRWKRSNQPASPPPFGTTLPADLQAVITVLVRRPHRAEPHRPMLLRASLPHISARHAEFDHPPRLARFFFTDSDLRAADFRGADLGESIMNYADLRWSFLSKTRMVGTQLHRADLRYAHMGGADLTGANITGANLSGAGFLTAEQLSVALLDQNTILPPSLNDDPWVVARVADCAACQVLDTPPRCPPPTPEPMT